MLAHRLTTDASRAAPVFHYVVEDLEPDATYLAMAWVYLDAAFRGRDVGLAMMGRPSLRHARADVRQRDHWQQVWVVAHASREQPRMLPSLLVEGEAGSLLYTAGWDFGRYASMTGLHQQG